MGRQGSTSPGTPQPEPALRAAARVWERAVAGAADPSEAANRLSADLRIRLGRWIGSDGYRVLLARVLGEVMTDHPILAQFHRQGEEETAPVPITDEEGTQVAAGMVALLTAMMQLLGRITGDEMARNLIEQCGMPDGRHAEPEEAQDG